MLLLSHRLMLLQGLLQVLSLSCVQLSFAAATAPIALSAVVIACGVAKACIYCCIGKYTFVGCAAAGCWDCCVCSCLVSCYAVCAAAA